MAKNKIITVQGIEISFFQQKEEDYISLTDITKKFPDGKQLVPRWLRNRDTLEFIGVWEKLNNPDFQVVEFDNLYEQSGKNRFSLSVKRWTDTTNAIGLQARRQGKVPATFAHRDIALGFCYWLSPPFQLYVIKEFQRLKAIEVQQQQEALEWSLKRVLSKINYTVHTDAIKDNLIPPRLSGKEKGIVYASEADVLNMAVFGMTAKEWRLQYPKAKGNIRDNATHLQLLILANLEATNAELIRMGLSQDERLTVLNKGAIQQMISLVNSPSLSQLPSIRKELP